MKYVLIFCLSLSFMGCASFGRRMKALLSGDDKSNVASENSKNSSMRYSEKPEGKVTAANSRQYRRVTKETFDEEARGEEQEGSLWVMEGQGSYLFSQNMVRLVGDILNVKLDGEPRHQLETKVDVIKKLIKKSKPQPRAVAAAPEGAPAAAGEKPAEKPDDKKAADGKKPDGAAPAAAAAAKKPDDDDDKGDEETSFGVSSVPSRIVEKMQDGSYRIKGSQTFMIGRNEYKVILTGVVRSNDVTDEGIDSSRMLDSKFDIVTVKKDLRL